MDPDSRLKSAVEAVEFPDGLVVWRWLVDCINDLTGTAGFLLSIRSMLTNLL